MKYPPYLDQDGDTSWDPTPWRNEPILNGRIVYRDVGLMVETSTGNLYPLLAGDIEEIIRHSTNGIATIPLWLGVTTQWNNWVDVVMANKPTDERKPLRYRDLPAGSALLDGDYHTMVYCRGPGVAVLLNSPFDPEIFGNSDQIILYGEDGHIYRVIDEDFFIPDTLTITEAPLPRLRDIVHSPTDPEITISYRVVGSSDDSPFVQYGEHIYYPDYDDYRRLPKVDDWSPLNDTLVEACPRIATPVSVEVQYLINGQAYRKVW